MTKSATSVVCDAGPIIHLDEIGCLHLMNDFESVLVPDCVYNEVYKNRPEALKGSDYIHWTRISQSTPLEKSLKIICQMFSLDAGETEALAILTDKPDCIFLTDDAAARLAAEKLRFRVHGTIGVLIRAVRMGLMNPQQVVNLLNLLPSKSSLYIKPSLLEEVISSVKQRYDI